MKNGYEIFWTDYALDELAQTIKYLEENWTEKEIKNFFLKLEETIGFIVQNPYFFQVSDFEKEIRRAIILNHNTLYYRIKNNSEEVISLFSHRQDPKKRKLK